MSDCATLGGLTLPLPLFSTYVSRNGFTTVAVKMKLNGNGRYPQYIHRKLNGAGPPWLSTATGGNSDPGKRQYFGL